MNKTSAQLAMLGLLACAGSLHAHHSGSMYETTPLWVQGTVVGVERVNPHTLTRLEETRADGQIQRWTVEGPGQAQLERLNIDADLPKVGDVIAVCAFAYKPATELSRIFPGVDFSGKRLSRSTDDPAQQFVAGHVLVLPDGERRMWEPHGRLGECMRSSDDQRQSWLDFLTANPAAWQAWCQQREFAVGESAASLRDFMEEIDGALVKACE